MKVQTEGIKEVTVGKNDSGNYEYKDTGKIVNTGDKAFMIMNEDPISGAMEKVFFQDKEAAERFN